MDNLTLAPHTDPTALYRLRDELYAADMLVAAVAGLDFFSWLDATPGTIDDIARHFDFRPRPVDVMTTLFVAMELLARDGATLRVTARAREHLVGTSPWSMKSYYPTLADRPIARDLLDVLRTGQPANYASREDEADWHRAMESEKVAEEFTAAMDCRGRLVAPALAKNLDLGHHRRLLDIAGGSGIYACALVAQHPELTATVIEKSPVNRIAERAIAGRGFGGRVGVEVLDMLTEALPAGYDVHLFSNVLHDWDEVVVRQLMQASADALPSGGLVVIHEALLNADKSGPYAIAAYSVLLMHVTQGRCYSAAELDGWLSDAGFGPSHLVPSAIGRSALVARKV